MNARVPGREANARERTGIRRASLHAPTARAVLAILTLLLTAACAPLSLTDEKGSIHYVVLGFGVVTVPQPKEETAVLATKIQAVGATITNQPGFKFNAGYVASSIVAIPDRAEDVRVEISQLIGGPLIVDSQSAILRDFKSMQREQHHEPQN